MVSLVVPTTRCDPFQCWWSLTRPTPNFNCIQKRNGWIASWEMTERNTFSNAFLSSYSSDYYSACPHYITVENRTGGGGLCQICSIIWAISSANKSINRNVKTLKNSKFLPQQFCCFWTKKKTGEIWRKLYCQNFCCMIRLIIIDLRKNGKSIKVVIGQLLGDYLKQVSFWFPVITPSLKRISLMAV